MTTDSEISLSDHKTSPPDLSNPFSGVNRRKFLKGVKNAAALTMTAGLVSLEPLISGGNTAQAFPEVNPLTPNDRLAQARAVREAAALYHFDQGMPVHENNGDEDEFPNYIANYSKGLPHNHFGEVDGPAYNALMNAIGVGTETAFNAVPLGGSRKLTNPRAGLCFDLEGKDPQQFTIPPAPKFNSAEQAGEMVELYWMALLRDVNFLTYDRHPLVAAALAELNGLSDFRGPKANNVVTVQTLFRDDVPGGTVGPYLSQFMWLFTPFGAEVVDRRMQVLAAGSDKMTDFNEWLAVQRGNVPGTERFKKKRRYITTGRDLAQWVHIDVLFQAYFNACLILGTPPGGGGIGCPLNPSNPYSNARSEEGFGTWGAPFIKTLMCEAATRALKAVWFQKWMVHRRLRPEAFGGRIHIQKISNRYPGMIHDEVLGSEAVDRVHGKYGSYLLPMVFPEGSPTHPAYGAGHATVAGASVTILKAMFDENYVIPNPVVPNPAGTTLHAYSGEPLTVGGELNKLASNVATGRNMAGVHWRTDAYWSLRLGEEIAIELLRDTLTTFNEDMSGGITFTDFDGRTVTITPSGVSTG
ncbi:vanadium-dependent haloperoxidase [Methylocaldum sp.]|uniref:vanadium-dependent haloperoxidase n=1 Tax=Methylocaldum sp. TaxID=1969727 RepID=UPI002D33C265|nr:vanadium-dependent haloperoxidase [Methylocaldum sp.]HYE35374.1 vanadium-dependent haloperoxidase [Methylocaldum sp.]